MASTFLISLFPIMLPTMSVALPLMNQGRLMRSPWRVENGHEHDFDKDG